MRVISYPERPRRTMKRPPWWRTWWMPTGTVVEYRGRAWKKEIKGAADSTWHEWVLAKGIDLKPKAGRMKKFPPPPVTDPAVHIKVPTV